jgi:hypothetical protein
MEKCRKCKHHFYSINKVDKCSIAKTELGHAVIFENCITTRSKDTGCGLDAILFTPTTIYHSNITISKKNNS